MGHQQKQRMERAHKQQRALLVKLSRELFQTETSASWHCRREAETLGDTPPARALAALADHADGVLRELPELAKRHELPVSGLGHLVGRLFSTTRQRLLDRLIDAERSYRGTLLGIRHGMDLVQLMAHTADAIGDDELARWCRAWLEVRRQRAIDVEAELVWFARHPVAATQSRLRTPMVVAEEGHAA
jgi:hypothetical protein